MNRTSAARRATTCLLALAFLTPAAANACTSFQLGAADGGKIYARTMEFGLPLKSQMIVVPRNLALTGTGPDAAAGSGLRWASRFGATGMNGLGLPILIDGMNEAGLSGGLLYLPNLALFQETSPAEAANSVASYEMLLFALTSFATVAEAKAGMPRIKINRAPQATFGMPVPVHMTLHDSTGASAVFEYVGGTLHIHDNPTTVVTNGPTFDWHVTNLNNYLNLSLTDPKPRKVGDIQLSPPSTGTGLLGLPGDMSSPSRFVRAFAYAFGTPVAATSAEAVASAFHLLNNFDIPPGSIRTEAGAAAGGGVAGYETTEWMAVADLKTKRYYLRTYGNSQSRMVDLARADLDAKAIRFIPVDQPDLPLDLSR